MVYFEDGLVEQDILEAFALQSYQRIVDLEKYGATYNRDSNGRLTGTPQRGLKHVIHYTQKPFGAGGKKMVHGLVNEAKRLGVKLMSKIFITNLLTADGKAIGSVLISEQVSFTYSRRMRLFWLLGVVTLKVITKTWACLRVMVPEWHSRLVVNSEIWNL